MKKVVTVHDSTQKEYQYERVEPVGKNFAPDFKPELSPKEMLELGIFGGKYLDEHSGEFPKEWFQRAKLVMSPEAPPDKNLNCFRVLASQPLSVWKEKGWVYKDDPKGWFQWYCRYFMGRRLPEEDARQIRRWKAIKRHMAQVALHCEPRDCVCRPRQRQAILHWAYDSRKI